MAATTIVKMKTERNHLQAAKAKEVKAIHVNMKQNELKKVLFLRHLF
jgi:hypothetical protein